MSHHARRLLGLALLGAVVCWSPALPAQSPERKAAAQVAFDKALKLLEEGDVAKACALLEDSLRLDAAMGTQYQLAQCYEQSGRYASAWASYVAVADSAKAAGSRDREQWARDRAASLEPKLSRLVIEVPAPVAKLPGLVVERDGSPVPQGLWGEAVPVDGGAHRVVVRADGRSPWTKELNVLPASDRTRVELPMLEPAAGGATGAAPSTPASPPEPGEPAVSESDAASSQTVAGVVVAGAGLAAATAGVIVGVLAKSSYDESGEQHCVDDLCDEEGVAAAEDARAQGNLATALFVVGSAALVAGVVTWILAPSEADASPDPAPAAQGLRVDLAGGPGQAGLALRARW